MRRLHWIFWLMLALLPLRGWAYAAMPLEPLQAQLAAAPCHGDPAASVDASAAAPHDADGAPAAGHECSLCEFCHSAAAPADLPTLERDAPRALALPDWRSHAAPDAERRAPYKPPRG